MPGVEASAAGGAPGGPTPRKASEMCEVHSDPERGVWKDISGAETGWDGWYSQLFNDLNDLKTPQNGDVS